MDKLWINTMHINKLSSSLCHQLKNIQNIRGKLDFEAVKTVVQALILANPDYSNSLLVGMPECHLSQLQHIQNMAAGWCVIWENMTMLQHQWSHCIGLRGREHISYKIACQVHQCKVGTAPQYLIDLLPVATHNHSLRSSTSGNLQSAKWRTSLANEGYFSSAGPKIWNSILPDVRAKKSRDSFRKSLKTYLFGQSYPT